jgi:hypothetical protein
MARRSVINALFHGILNVVPFVLEQNKHFFIYLNASIWLLCYVVAYSERSTVSANLAPTGHNSLSQFVYKHYFFGLSARLPHKEYSINPVTMEDLVAKTTRRNSVAHAKSVIYSKMSRKYFMEDR